MTLDKLLGNEALAEDLTAALAAERLGHAVLLTAPEGAGRNFAARCLAADYLFPQGGPGAEAVLRGQGSEVLTVAGEGKSGQISVEAIRAVRSDIFRSALSAAGRVVLVRDAHAMTQAAANALLKVLEEPPSKALFILTARESSGLPATIVSRCAQYPLGPAPLALCRATLARAMEDPAQNPLCANAENAAKPQADLPELLTALYGGRIGMGLRALAEEGRLAVARHAIEAARAAMAGDGYTLLRIFSAYEGKAEGDRARREALLADLTDALATGLSALGDQSVLASFSGGVRSLDVRPAPEAGVPSQSGAPLRSDASPQKAAALLPFVLRAREELAGNVNPKILFAALALHLKKVNYK